MCSTPSGDLDIIHPYLLNSWTNYGVVYENSEIRKNKDGLVVMSGLVKGDFSKVILKLPKGWRPNKQLIFNVISENVSKRLDINPNGELFLNKNGITGEINGEGWVSLDGISFYAKQ